MEEQNLNPSAVEHWFSQGRLYNSIGSEHLKTRNSLIERGVLSAENAIFLLFGMANKIVEDYDETKEDHFKTIDSFFFSFSKNKRIKEAESLNYLGLAEQILFDTCDYLQNNITASLQYKKELGAVLRDMDLEINCSYKKIKKINEDTSQKISIMGREFFNAYVFDNINGEEGQNTRAKSWSMAEGINSLHTTTIKKISGEQRFPYASAFLNKHVFAPAKETYEQPDAEKMFLKYGRLQKTGLFGNIF